MKTMRGVLLVSAAVLLSSLVPGPLPGMRARSLAYQDSEGVESFHDGVVHYQGVRFSFDNALASEVKARTIPESLASAEQAAPGDTIYPRHVAFEVLGISAAPSKSFIKADIRVYSIAAYKRAFAADVEMAKEVSATIARLQRLLRTGNTNFRGAMPMLPLPNGYYVLRSHSSLLRFPDGSGFVFVTQGQQDEMPINNQNLSYEFLGLTDDGRYLVVAQFPVAAPFLAYNRDFADYGGVVQDCNCFSGPRYRRFKHEYQRYASGVKSKLDRLPADKFQPSLKLYDKLLSSLQIQ